MQNNRYLRTLISAGGAVVVNYLISLVLTSYITENVGTDAYGFVSLAKTVSNYAIILTSCLNAYAARYITIAFHQKDYDKASTYYSSVFYANIALSVIVILLAAIVIFFLDSLLNVPASLLRDVQILFLLDFINYMFLATGNVFTAYGYATDRLYTVNFIKCIAYIVEALVLIILYSTLSPTIIYVGIGLLASSFTITVFNYAMTKRYMPVLKLKAALCRAKAIKDLVVSGIWNSINSIGNLLQSGLDLIVSNLMLSTTEMGQLSIVKTLSTIFTTLYQTVSTPFQPWLLELYSDNNIDGVVGTLKRSMKISGFFSTMLFAGLIAYGYDYFELWTPNQDLDVLYTILLITIFGSVVEGIIYPLFYVYTLTLKNRVPCFVTILSGLLNVAGMYGLIRFFDFGLNAVVLTTTVLGWGTYFFFTPIYSARCLKRSAKTFFPTLLRILGAGCVSLIITGAISLIPVKNTWITLIIFALISTAVCLPIYFIITFGFKESKAIATQMIKKYIK